MKILISTIILAMAMVLSITVMIYGWGLEPQNWLVIIGGSLVAAFLSAISHVLTSD